MYQTIDWPGFRDDVSELSLTSFNCEILIMFGSKQIRVCGEIDEFEVIFQVPNSIVIL